MKNYKNFINEAKEIDYSEIDKSLNFALKNGKLYNMITLFRDKELLNYTLEFICRHNDELKEDFSKLSVWLIKNGANPNESYRKNTSFLIMAKKGYLDGIKSLLNIVKLEDINKFNTDGETALYLALENSHPDVAKYLIENGIDVSATLVMAAEKNYVEIFKMILDKLDPKDEEIYKAYKFASIKNNKELLDLLKVKELDMENKHIKLGEIHQNVKKILKPSTTINDDLLDDIYAAGDYIKDDKKIMYKIDKLTLKDRLYILTIDGSEWLAKLLLDFKNIKNYENKITVSKDEFKVQKVDADLLAEWFDTSESYFAYVPTEYYSEFENNRDEYNYFNHKLDNESKELIDKLYIEAPIAEGLNDEEGHKYYDFLVYLDFEDVADSFINNIDNANQKIFDKRKEEFEEFIKLDIEHYDNTITFEYDKLLELLIQGKTNFKNLSNIFNDDNPILCNINLCPIDPEDDLQSYNISNAADYTYANEEFRIEYEEKVDDLGIEEIDRRLENLTEYKDILAKLNWGVPEEKDNEKIYKFKRDEYIIVLNIGKIQNDGLINCKRTVYKNGKLIKTEDRKIKPVELSDLSQIELFDNK